MKENTVQDRKWRPIVDKEWYSRRFFFNEEMFLLKIVLKLYLTCCNLMFKPTLLNLYRLACKIRIVIGSNVCVSAKVVFPHKLYSLGRF